MFDHLLESSQRDDSNKWSNIAFGEEMGIIKIEIFSISGALRKCCVNWHIVRVRTCRTSPDYYEVVTQPMDMLKIQQKMKMDEYEEIEHLTADVELMVNNARAYYKVGAAKHLAPINLLLLVLFITISSQFHFCWFFSSPELCSIGHNFDPIFLNLLRMFFLIIFSQVRT